MESIEAMFRKISPLKTQKLVLAAQICWRTVAITTAFAATWMSVTSEEGVGYSSAFMFLAFANAFACGFTLLFVSVVFFFGRHSLTPTDQLLFLHELFLMSLMLSVVAAGTAVGYSGRFETVVLVGSIFITGGTIRVLAFLSHND